MTPALQQSELIERIKKKGKAAYFHWNKAALQKEACDLHDLALSQHEQLSIALEALDEIHIVNDGFADASGACAFRHIDMVDEIAQKALSRINDIAKEG